MTQRRASLSSGCWAAVAVLLFSFLPILEPASSVMASQGSGTSYTSPKYEYTVTWQLPWYFVGEDVEAPGFDVLTIADSRSKAEFSGGRSGLGSPGAVIEQYRQELQSASTLRNFQSVDEPQCASQSVASSISSACYRADLTYDDGSQGSVGIFLKAWMFDDGVDVLMSAFTQEPILTGYISHWNSFGVYPKGTLPPEDPGGCSLETHHGIDFCLDPLLPETDQNSIVEGVRLGQDAVSKLSANAPIGYLRVTGLNTVSSEGDEHLGSTLGNSIAVYAGSQTWRGITPLEQIKMVVHEYFHVYQIAMTNDSTAIVAPWFTEGSAESFGYTVASQIGVTDQSEFYSLAYYGLTTAPVIGNLRDFGTSVPMGASEYALAYMAVQYLLGSNGLSVEALGAVYQVIRSGGSFEGAFATVFGVSLEQFYVDFESWRLGMPKANSLDDDFYPNDGFTQGTFITWKYVPQQMNPGGQLLVVADTEPLLDCNLTLTLQDQTIQRETWANGQGEVFWLVSLPDSAVPGYATVGATCGGAPVSSSIAIT